MSQVTFHPGLNGLMLLLMAGVATILVAIFYRRAFRVLGWGNWVSLFTLRIVAIAIVLLLLFRPVFSHQRQVKERRGLLFLIDRSASMSIADDATGGSRLEQATDLLGQWLPRLGSDFDIDLVAFSDEVSPLDDAGALGSLLPIGEATSLSRVLESAPKVAALEDTEALFLISDGVHNSARNPIAIAAQLGVPVYTIGTGQTGRDNISYRDVRVTEVEVAEQMSVDHLARVTGNVDAVGFPGRVITAGLAEDGTQVAELELALDGIEGPQEITFEFTPKLKGLHRYTVTVPTLEGEKIPQNNERSTSGLVIEPRIRVLYIEGTLRAEYGALVGRFLAKDPNIEFCALVQTRPNVFMQRSNIETLQLDSIPDDPDLLDTIDVFMIGDLDSTYFHAGQMELIRQRVRDGAGLIMLGGYHSLGPGGYQGTPLEDVLPIMMGDRDVGQVDQPFQPQLTPAGRQHPIFANIAQFFPSLEAPAEIEGLPELAGCVRVQSVKPGATVLSIHATEMVAGDVPLPVLAVQPAGQGRGAVFTADTTRNWQQTLRSLDRDTPFLRFWGQMVRWLAGRSEEVATEAGIVATTDKSYYEPESPVTITAVVRGKDGEATSDARVNVAIAGPGERTTQLLLAPVAGPAGNFRVVFEPRQSGQFELKVDATLNDAVITTDPLHIEVGRPNLEFDRLDLDQEMLTAIATQSGGRYAHISTADRLFDLLRRKQQARLVQYEVALAWPPLMWVAFVGVLTTEWLLRRRYALR